MQRSSRDYTAIHRAARRRQSSPWTAWTTVQTKINPLVPAVPEKGSVGTGAARVHRRISARNPPCRKAGLQHWRRDKCTALCWIRNVKSGDHEFRGYCTCHRNLSSPLPPMTAAPPEWVRRVRKDRRDEGSRARTKPREGTKSTHHFVALWLGAMLQTLGGVVGLVQCRGNSRSS